MNTYITPNARDTSVAFFLEEIDDTSVGEEPFQKWYQEFVSARDLFYSDNLWPGYLDVFSIRSAHPIHFNQDLFFTKFYKNILVHMFKEQLSISILDLKDLNYTRDYQHHTGAFLTQASADDAWITFSCNLMGSTEEIEKQILEIHEVEKDINALLHHMKMGQPLPRSQELGSLAERVVSQMSQREEEDIEEWAERLADDLSKVTD